MYTDISKQIAASMAVTRDGPFASISPMWSNLIEQRENFPDEREFPQFLSNDSRFVTGIGMGGALSDAEYRAVFQRWVERYRSRISATEIETWPEPTVGSPMIVECDGYRASVLYLKNYSLARVFEDVVKRHSRRKSGLRVLEIGAGYGAVGEILMRKGIAGSYTSVDLPENLVLTAGYLDACFPDRQVVVGNAEMPETFSDPADLRFILPNDITSLAGQFDLVINASSFGEMPREVARAYIAWISEHLDGLFISHNGHARGKIPELVQRQSQYGFEAFSVVELFADPSPAGVLHDQHVVAVLKKGQPPSAPFWNRVDMLAQLLQIGLHDEVNALFRVLVSDRESEFIDRLSRFLTKGDIQSRRETLVGAVSNQFENAILQFLRAGVAYQQGERAETLWKEYLSSAKSPAAMTMALAALNDPETTEAMGLKIPGHFREQIDTLNPSVIRARLSTSLDLPEKAKSMPRRLLRRFGLK